MLSSNIIVILFSSFVNPVTVFPVKSLYSPLINISFGKLLNV